LLSPPQNGGVSQRTTALLCLLYLVYLRLAMPPAFVFFCWHAFFLVT
jgi:hypothetical protein